MDWFQSQNWVRDSEGPVLSLGPSGAFDDTHIFAPCVIRERGTTFLWYCGSQGSVEDRVFDMGLATSDDGLGFIRHPASPVLRFGAGRSILTPAVLRHPDGSVCREDGRIRMWFSSCHFPSGDASHTLHETSSADGVVWTEPTGPLVVDAYAPTVIRENGRYRMWYTDVREDPWSIRTAESVNGRDWTVFADPVLEVDQGWERQRLVYPTVLTLGRKYLMWYGSYSNKPGTVMTTALGFAISDDGYNWRKSHRNPVFGPDRSRPWESHFTTSQSILGLPDGSWRIWYASRKKPPFDHKYFAIGTARWAGPGLIPA